MNHPQQSAMLAFVFPGQGSQSIGMLAELSELHAGIRETFAEASDGAGVDLWALSQGGPEAMLNRTEYTQPALLAAGVAVWRVWLSPAARGRRSSPGTASANTPRSSPPARCRCGRGTPRAHPRPGDAGRGAGRRRRDGCRARRRGCARRGGLPRSFGRTRRRSGELQLAGTDRDRRSCSRGRSGARALAARGVRKAVKLAVSVPSHTPLMREAANRVLEAMSAYTWREPAIPIVQNVDANVHRRRRGDPRCAGASTVFAGALDRLRRRAERGGCHAHRRMRAGQGVDRVWSSASTRYRWACAGDAGGF